MIFVAVRTYCQINFRFAISATNKFCYGFSISIITGINKNNVFFVVGLIFTLVKKLKPCGSNFPPLYYSLSIFRLYKVQGDDGQLPTNPSVTGDRISLFSEINLVFTHESIEGCHHAELFLGR